MNRSADFVMYWWDHAADLLARKGSRLKRFGFVTTNSITQPFSRRVLAKRLDGRPPIHLTLAVPDHPWTKAAPDTAAVRIAMTVAVTGAASCAREGILRRVVAETDLDTDQPRIDFVDLPGPINADLTVGADMTSTTPLRANAGLCSRGVQLHGSGFIVTPAQAEHLGLGSIEGLERHIRPYRNGRDLTVRARGVMVIDLLGLEEAQVRRHYPEVYGHLLRTVKPDRAENNRATYRNNWWIFGEPRRELRPALTGLPRYIATVETAKHRLFQFLDAAIIPDNMLVCLASDDAFHLGILSSTLHILWALRAGGWLGVGNDPRYSKSRVFDPFPFPDAASADRLAIAALAEELDETRKAVLAAHGDLTLTTLYNLRDRIIAGDAFDWLAQDQRLRGRVDILHDLHRQIDAAVARSYGWAALPSDEEIVARLVALNAERVREERAGTVRWLRPTWQLARSGIEMLGAQAGPEAQYEAILPHATPRKPTFPRDAIGQTAAVLQRLQRGGPITAAHIADAYAQGLRALPRIEATLAALARLGHVTVDGAAYRLRKVA